MPKDLLSPPQPALVAAELRIAVARLARRLRRETDGEHTASAVGALATIERHGPLTLGELADAEGISRPSVTALAVGLETHGLIVRESDLADRRLVRVRISPRGARALQRSRTRRNAFLARRLEALDPEELATLSMAAGIMERLLEDAP